MNTMRETLAADEAMRRVWSEWFSYYERHFRGNGIAISMADQQAFYEIAQPIMRALATPQPPAAMPGREEIAQIIDPIAFIVVNSKRPERVQQKKTALAKADAILALLPAAEWQPIETAPEDGTEVLYFGAQGRWIGNHPPNCMRGNWNLNGLGGWTGSGTNRSATHWMHLPAPPAQEADRG